MQLLAFNNRITDLPPALCDKSSWMDGLVASGCDALLCPKGTFSDAGRRTVSQDCQPCDKLGADLFYGASKCGIVPDQSDEDILKEFFEVAKGDLWDNKSGWMSGSFCNWFGICGDFVENEKTDPNTLYPQSHNEGCTNRQR